MGKPLSIFGITMLLVPTPINAVSPDCQNVINLAIGLNLDAKQPVIWNNLRMDCCNEYTVTCSNNMVRFIDWNSLQLDGSINGSAIPASLKYLNLHGNDITGNIPNPISSNLTELYLDGNRMTGDVPPIPIGMVKLELGNPGSPGNHFTGSVVIKSPIYFYINYNWITDVIIQDTSSLIECDLSHNPLLRNPNIAGLSMCTKQGLYNASLLPITASVSTSTGLHTSTANDIASLIKTTFVQQFTTISNRTILLI